MNENPTDDEKLKAMQEKYAELEKKGDKTQDEQELLRDIKYEITFLTARMNAKSETVTCSECKTTFKTEQEFENHDCKSDGQEEFQEWRNNQAKIRAKLQELKQRKKALNENLKVFELQSQIEKLEEKLEEKTKEDRFVTSKPDKGGIITLDEKKYKKRMKELQAELTNAKGFREKSAIQADINQLRMAKVQTKINNVTANISKGASAVGKFVNDLQKSLGSLSKFNVFEEEKSKGKKSKGNDDFGFNDSVFKN